MQGLVFDIKEFAVFDGPGIRTTVFLKGCPLHCMWCHNPEGIRNTPELMVSRASCVHCGACEAVCPLEENAEEGAWHPEGCTACGRCVPVCRGGFRKIAGTYWEAGALATRLSKDADVYRMSEGGVTFSGGEPLLQWDFVKEVIGGLPADVHTAVETSGICTDEVFREVMDTVSLVMIDFKLWDPERHKKYTGVSNETVFRHIEALKNGTTPFILRLPVIPGVNDVPEHFKTAAELVRGAEKLIRVDLLPYQRAAGAKYEMVGREYRVDFDETKKPEMYPEFFEEAGISVKIFK